MLLNYVVLWKLYVHLISTLVNKSLINVSSIRLPTAVNADRYITGPFKDYPQVTVYHPTSGRAFANIGWTGWLGSITGRLHII